MERQIEIGARYKHFKGNTYRVMMLAKDSETKEDIVIYKAIYGDCKIWVRPLNMFMEQITRDGNTFNRFEEIETNQT